MMDILKYVSIGLLFSSLALLLCRSKDHRQKLDMAAFFCSSTALTIIISLALIHNYPTETAKREAAPLEQSETK